VGKVSESTHSERLVVKFRRLPVVLVTSTLTLLFSSMFFAPRTSSAMPEFAQATGLQCSACHTQVPLLNAYGRYVQRTGYAAIERAALDKTFPLWLDEEMNYDSTAGKGTGTPQYDFGNLAVHAVGYAAPDITYHVQQWITQGSQSGGLDTAWVAYAPAFAPDMHLFAGKILNPAPSPYSQTSDIDGPAASSTVVGEHDWGATYNNRWGTRLAYVSQTLDVEAGYYLSSDDLNGLTDFSPGDKSFQWKVALAQAKSPLEVGIFGSTGTIPVSTGNDIYQSQAGYVQLDAGKNYRPGVLVIYQRQTDSNPGTAPNGNPYIGASSWGSSAEIFESLFNGNALLSYRHDLNNAGITGGLTNGNAVNFAFNVPIPKFPYLHGYVEANLGGNSSLSSLSGAPEWKGMLWLALPIVLHP
jgi:hypothetical protein